LSKSTELSETVRDCPRRSGRVEIRGLSQPSESPGTASATRSTPKICYSGCVGYHCGIGKPQRFEHTLSMTTIAAEERRRPIRPGPPPRRYTLASFDNLIVLANYEERLREARKMVWRDRGEPAVEVHDLWECLEHGLRGGLRAS
jgi:hypothetical protein